MSTRILSSLACPEWFAAIESSQQIADYYKQYQALHQRVSEKEREIREQLLEQFAAIKQVRPLLKDEEHILQHMGKQGLNNVRVLISLRAALKPLSDLRAEIDVWFRSSRERAVINSDGDVKMKLEGGRSTSKSSASGGNSSTADTDKSGKAKDKQSNSSKKDKQRRKSEKNKSSKDKPKKSSKRSKSEKDKKANAKEAAATDDNGKRKGSACMRILTIRTLVVGAGTLKDSTTWLLKQFFYLHCDNPYPTEDEKVRVPCTLAGFHIHWFERRSCSPRLETLNSSSK